ncbi:MAG: lysylphosphatidylglycerol synthase transmembrane domain-containing protein [Candidatus Pacebacteria bacterium]|nr:lysylphosphatidylglycerol synthase transmembrane domain-containing protein [Candidatus Paceibacterota bacterium]
MKKYTKRILKTIVSLIFLFWVIFKVNWAYAWKSFLTINAYYLIAYILVIILGMFICAYKWQILAKYKEINLNFGHFFKFYLAGTFINNFMPSFIGGDTFKAYETGKTDGRYIEAASSVMMDRITGLFAATILAIIFTLLNLKTVLGSPVLIIVNLAVLLSFSIDITIMLVRKKAFWSRFKKYFPEKFVAFMIDLGTYNGDHSVMNKTILLGMLFDFVGIALANYILFAALGIKIGMINYLSVIFLISIISSVPITINNIGIKAWSYIAFFGVFGLDSSLVATVSVLSSVIQVVISLFALPVYLRSKK